MANELGPVVQSAMLRAELVQLRRDRDLTQEVVARALDWHPSKLIRIEGGRSRISKTDLQALLLEYGVTSEKRQERLQALAQGARGPAWWDEYRDVTDEVTISYIGHEAGAAVIRQFETSLVPGLLQTREYATTIVSRFTGSARARRSVELRMRRQDDLTRRESPPRQHYLVDEAVIRRHVGVATDREIAPRQLRRIVDSVEGGDHITVRVVPFTAGAYVNLGMSFTLLEFEGTMSDALYLEGVSSLQTRATFTKDDDIVSGYRDAFEAISADALSVRDSVALIRSVADELEAAE